MGRDRGPRGWRRRAGRAVRLAAVYAIGVISILGSGTAPAPEAETDPPPQLPRTPIVLEVSEHHFGGDPIFVRVTVDKRGSYVAQLRFTSTLPTGALGLPTTATVPADLNFIELDLPTNRVPDFVTGRVAVEWTNRPDGVVTADKPVTLMPEPTALQLSFTPGAVPGGLPVTLGLSIAPAYPVNLRPTLSSDSPLLPVPAQITVPAGRAATLTVDTGTTATARTVNVTARLRGAVDVESLLVNTTASGQMPLTLAVSGGGSVTSAPAGIDCGGVCTAAFTVGTRVTLTPVAAAGQRFYAWSGDADCSDGVLTMAAARTCTATFAPALAPYADGVGWRLLGAALTQSEVDPAPSLARDGNHPLVAHVSAVGGDVARLFVRRYDGTSFVALGGGALNASSITAASEPSLVTTVTGQPVVAWIQGDGIQQNVFVARFNGSAWESVGPPGVPLNVVAGSTASQPSIALDAERQPMVAWLENGAVQFKRFDGRDWVTTPAGAGPPSSGANRVRMGADFDGVPVIAWRQGTGAAQALKVVRGFDFTALGAQVVASGGPVAQFALFPQVGGADVVYAATETPVTLRAASWSNGAWVDRGTLVTNDPRRLGAMGFARNQSSVAFVVGDSGQDSATLAIVRRDSSSQAWLGVTAPIASTFAARPLTLSHDWVTSTSPLLATSQLEAPGRYGLRVQRYYP